VIIPGDETGLEGLKKSIRLIWTELALILLKGRMNGLKVKDRLRLYASLRLLHMLLGCPYRGSAQGIYDTGIWFADCRAPRD
jgi:hypothetical protein